MGQTSARRSSRRPSEDPFWDLVATAKRLQEPGGCSWDRSQTISSLLPCLVEETWEVFEAIRRAHREDLAEELGDVLYTIVFLTLIAERRGWFTLERVLQTTREKMIRRHPHVFAGQTAHTPHQAYQQWQESKQREGTRRHSPSPVLRETLMVWWEWLRHHPDVLTRPLPVPPILPGVAVRRSVSGGPRQPNATRVPARDRSPSQGRN